MADQNPWERQYQKDTVPAEKQSTSADVEGTAPWKKTYVSPSSSGELSTSSSVQPSTWEVLKQPTEKTDKEYMGYTGPAGVAGATIHGLNRVAQETGNAVRGVYEMGKDIVENPDRPLIIPDTEGKYKGEETIVQKYNPLKGLREITKVPGAIRDINASPDPLTHYANAAEDTSAQGAGQALTAIAIEKAPSVVRGAGEGVERVIRRGKESGLTGPEYTEGSPVKPSKPTAAPKARVPYAEPTQSLVQEPNLVPTRPGSCDTTPREVFLPKWLHCSFFFGDHGFETLRWFYIRYSCLRR